MRGTKNKGIDPRIKGDVVQMARTQEQEGIQNDVDVTNKSVLVSYMASATGMTKKDCAVAFDAMWDGITASLEAGIPVRLTGYVSLEPIERPARTARNPRDGSLVEVPSKVRVRAKAKTKLQDAVSDL